MCCSTVWPTFSGLKLLLFSHFLPAMFGVEVSAAERHLFTLPLRFSGLGICNPVSLATNLFNCSVHSTENLVNSFVGIE